jgi:hypothetical protein
LSLVWLPPASLLLRALLVLLWSMPLPCLLVLLSVLVLLLSLLVLVLCPCVKLRLLESAGLVVRGSL